jgi:hypothetical protein
MLMMTPISSVTANPIPWELRHAGCSQMRMDAGDDGGDVAVQDGRPGTVEAFLDGGPASVLRFSSLKRSKIRTWHPAHADET